MSFNSDVILHPKCYGRLYDITAKCARTLVGKGGMHTFTTKRGKILANHVSCYLHVYIDFFY